MRQTTIAITMGDPAGVGPEIIARSWNHSDLKSLRRVVVGVPEIMQQAADLVGLPLRVRRLGDVGDAFDPGGEMGVIPISLAADQLTARRQVDPRCGEAAYQSLQLATELVRENGVAAIVTAPLNKQALRLAGHQVPGHTELLAQWCGVSKYAMMLYLPPNPRLGGELGLGVVHATLHLPLRDVFKHLSSDAITDACELATSMVRELAQCFEVRRPERIGVAALNPHGGEGGLLGDEEQRLIAPAVAAAKARGCNVTGPFPADTLLPRAAKGEFDALVAMYHDQGHIALKLLGMDRAVNVTLGLPIIRTSVAHGTAYDIAWEGRADETSMIAACRLAEQLARGRSRRSSRSKSVH